MKKILLVAALLWSGLAQAKPADVYLFYKASSESLAEIGITPNEMESMFDDTFGPASDELPDKVRYEDFYVSRFADGRYVFILNSAFNCGQIGCNTEVYERDADGDLMHAEGIFPVKCKDYASDKLLCIKGGYKVEKPKPVKKRGPVHYPAPVLTDE